MITDPAYEVAPWSLRERELDFDLLPQSESVFALSNGHIGWRGNLDEGEPNGLPGSYLNGVHELHPLPYAEAVYGDPESGQTVINVTNGKLIRLLVDDEPFDLRYGTIRSHVRELDMRAGVLRRECVWESPAGRTVRVRSTRMVSFRQRAVAAIAYEVEPLDDQVRVVIQSELAANEEIPRTTGDPRVAAALESPLVSEETFAGGTRLGLIHSTTRSGLRVATAADHRVDGPRTTTQLSSESGPDVSRLTVTSVLDKGERLRLEKFVAYGWSAARSLPALRDQADAALVGARDTGWQGLLDQQRAYLDRFWERADVEVDGDTEIQQAVRFALFHVLQSAARAEERAIPAKGLTGSGYDGHSFWDAETVVLPLLTFTAPHTAAEVLRWRHNMLPVARERARQLGFEGAAFPWRTINGDEASGYWPAGTAAFHVNADIADAVVRYVAATGDTAFEADTGLELLVETARLWRSLGHHDHAGAFHIDGVTGPDEYSAVSDDNLYTNLMAQANLVAAADAAERHPRHAEQLGVTDEETAAWRDAAAATALPWDEDLGVHQQSAGFTRHQRWDFEATDPENYPLLLHYPYFDLYRKQVVKQADLVLAMFLRGDAFTDEQKARNFAYYEPLTVRDSSLSAYCQSVIAAEVGHLQLAYDYLGESAMMDLEDLENNARDGLHIAALAGTWSALVSGLGGMRLFDGDAIRFAPRLPDALSRVAFRLMFRGRRLLVEIRRTEATYTLAEGEPIEIVHYGEAFTLGHQPVVRKLAPVSHREPPHQPPDRAPRRRAQPSSALPPR
ncbi:glycoside hydrolase family 65 protein [Actinacidiphila yeochonensis]|uniref:glycoside hydrolase family 65 protein n=1 Tax=Actinacidiphila yeochonensis TaxID=89050 RepID=UPI00055BDCC2|nr:glycosyl hydrolase family 65 protein [Actinacidiphila yeochonensis]